MYIPDSPIVVLAPDSFKGSLSATQVCECMQRGVLRAIPHAQCLLKPMADGGEGTVEALVTVSGGIFRSLEVIGPLGSLMHSTYGISPDGQTAFIETAAASGFQFSNRTSSDLLQATTQGTGQLVLDALNQGVRHIILGLGGSATNDGGSGFLQALGVRFLDKSGAELAPGGAALSQLSVIDTTHIDPRLSQVTIQIAADVTNPLLGANGASAVYGPQKGASAEDVQRLDDALLHYANLVMSKTGTDYTSFPGAGAAGGLGFGLLSFTQVSITPGAKLIGEYMGLPEAIRQADIVFTGEGRIDRQTLSGKTASRVAAWAMEFGKPIIAFGGSVEDSSSDVFGQVFTQTLSITPPEMALSMALSQAPQLLEQAVYTFCRSLS